MPAAARAVDLVVGQRGHGVGRGPERLDPVGRLPGPLQQEGDPAQGVHRVQSVRRVDRRACHPWTTRLARCRNARRPPSAASRPAWARSPRRAIARMDEVLPWYRAMPAENRSWVNLVAQAGVAAFVEWFRAAGRPAGDQRRRVRHRPARADPVGDPAADRRAGPGRHRGGRGADRADRAGRRGRGARGGAALLAGDRLRRGPGLRRRRPRPAAPGTPGWSRWWSTRCCAARRTTRCGRAPRRWAGAATTRWSSWSGTRLTRSPKRSSTRSAGWPGPRTWTC